MMRKMTLREVQLMQLELMKEVDWICKKYNLVYYLIAGSCLGAVRHGGFIPWDDDIDIAMLREDYDRFVELFGEDADNSRYFIQNYKTEKSFVPALTRICIKNTCVDIPSDRHLKYRKNTYIDVFPLDTVPDDIRLRERQKYRLKLIDRLMNLKQYHIYKGTVSEYIVKKSVALILSVIPLRFLQKLRCRVMTAYSTLEASCVCSTTSKYGYDKQIIAKEIYGNPVRQPFEGIEFNMPERTEDYLKQLYGPNYMQLPPENKRVVPHDVYML